MDKYKVLALFGESASGKDTCLNQIVEDFPIKTHKIISCTTRPKREKEINAKDYFFVSEEDFAKKLLDGTLIEATRFRDWFYGTPKDGLDKDKINIGVFNIEGIRCMMEEPEIDLRALYIKASDKTRLLRALQREQDPDCEEICRRFQTDKKDFSFIPFSHYSWLSEKTNVPQLSLKNMVFKIIQNWDNSFIIPYEE
jgi:guanylate kinase